MIIFKIIVIIHNFSVNTNDYKRFIGLSGKL